LQKQAGMSLYKNIQMSFNAIQYYYITLLYVLLYYVVSNKINAHYSGCRGKK